MSQQSPPAKLIAKHRHLSTRNVILDPQECRSRLAAAFLLLVEAGERQLETDQAQRVDQARPAADQQAKNGHKAN